MKKNWKKVLSLVLALAMVFAMSTTVFASANNAGTVTVVNNLSGHSYDAYQILSGTYAIDGSLSDVAWGSGVDSTDLLSDLTGLTAFASCTSAEEVAEVLVANNTDDTVINAFVEAAYANCTTASASIAANADSVQLASGYYLIVDTTSSVSGTSVKAYNNALLQVVGSTVTIRQKTDAPSVEKKVQEIGYSEANSTYVAEYNDVADYSIGDTIGYQLIGTIPDTSEYAYYRYIFTDTLSKGLTADTTTVKVYLADSRTMTTAVEIPASNYTVSTAAYSGQNSTYTGGTVLTVSFDDILSLKDSNGAAISLTGYSYIIVAYNATLNENAVIGLDGNPNEVYLTYSSNPNSTSANDTEDETEDTPEDKVIVFTYELDVTKVAAENTSTTLKDAEFILYYTDGGTTYYVQVDANSKVTGWTTDKTAASSLISGSDGVFKVIGLEDRVYTLEETVSPTGYNLLSNPITLTIAATTANGQNWTSGTASEALTGLTIKVDSRTAASGVLSTGVVSTTVTNTKGSVLPTTGGIGTTIFYIVGAVLVLGAAVVLVTRRRVSR